MNRLRGRATNHAHSTRRRRARPRIVRRRFTAFLLPFLLAAQALIQVTPLAPATIASAAGPGPSVTIAPGASASVAIDVAVPTRPPAADILIAIDTTGSMGPSIDQAKSDATAIVNGVRAAVGDSQFAVVDFKDSVDGTLEYRVTHAMTGAAADVQAAINGMEPGGGGDAPEAHNLVLHNSYTPAVGGAIGWRSGTKKIVVIISDAEPHGAGAASEGLSGCLDTSGDIHGFSTSTELAGLAAADRTLFMIRQVSIASTSSLACYQSIVARTPGGVAVDSGTALGSQIVSLIDSSFTANVADLHLLVASATPAPADASWISFSPTSMSDVATPSTQTFTANVSVPAGTAAGTYTFDLTSIADGADIGHTSLTVTVGVLGVPIVSQAVPQGPQTLVAGVLKATPSTTYHLRFVTSASCTDSVIGGDAVPFATADAITNAAGDAYFGGSVTNTAPLATYVAAQIVPPGGSSDIGPCIVASPDNDQWTRALNITGSTTSNGYIDISGRARWYKFNVQPGSRVTVSLSGLPADYDLFLFKDIGQAYTTLTDPASLTRLSAEFAPSAFSPSAFSPSAFSPSAFSPSAFSPSAFSPSAFSPSAFSPSAFSPSAFSPSAFSPSAFSPSAFSPSAFSPSAFSPSGFSPSAFSGAQTRSLIGVSAGDGTASEGLVADTWNNTGSFYVRVSGKNGASSLGSPFSLRVTLDPSVCDGVAPVIGTISAPAGGYKTLILTAQSRMSAAIAGNSTADKSTLNTKLAAFAGRPEIAGVVVDVGGPGRISTLQAQADTHSSCMYAKNLVALAIRDVVTAYRTANPGLKYVVLVGGDGAIPFFRYPDQSLLGPESDYQAPVLTGTASEASLRSNYVLGQDAYGSSIDLSLHASAFPVPDLPVGRLVETAAEASGMIDAYMATAGGVVAAPTKSLVTGYDFLADAATSVSGDLAAGMGTNGTVDKLITSKDIAPGQPCDATHVLPNCSWNATALRTALVGARHDLIFLAGHFSANNALAADFQTTLATTDIGSANLTNSIVFSAGCHSGYNVVDPDAVTGGSVDWAQALARKQATLIAGTGYQYGDTDFLEYSERIYAEFAHQLRVGAGAVSIGDALMRAKQIYLANTPDIRGLHEKALLESSIFGLPMLSVNMPGTRDTSSSPGTTIGTTTAIATKPGLTLGLRYANTTVSSTLTPHTVDMSNIGGGSTTAKYYSGSNGVVTNPDEPAIPLETRDVTVAGEVLRGVGFLGGSYADETVIPLTGAPADPQNQIRGIHRGFASPVFYPMRLSAPNYFGALVPGGTTNLLATPAQHRATGLNDGSAILRTYSNLNLRLFYSHYTGPSAASGPPTITGVNTVVASGNVTFTAHVVGDPSAGIQQVWVTYTGHANAWESVDLIQDPIDSTLWSKTMALPTALTGRSIEFMVQAVNGVGLVSLDDNVGRDYAVGGKANQVISFSPISPKSLGDADFTVSATSSAGLTPVTITTAGGCTVAGVTVHINAVGPCTLTGTQGGDATHYSASATATIQVIWPYMGFFSPVDNPPIDNVANSGSAIPVKFSLGGNRGLAILALGSPTANKFTCGSDPTDVIEEVSTATTSGLEYDAASGQYKYTWKTLKAYAGTCYQLKITLADGTTHMANFRFK